MSERELKMKRQDGFELLYLTFSHFIIEGAYIHLHSNRAYVYRKRLAEQKFFFYFQRVALSCTFKCNFEYPFHSTPCTMFNEFIVFVNAKNRNSLTLVPFTHTHRREREEEAHGFIFVSKKVFAEKLINLTFLEAQTSAVFWFINVR